MRLVPLTCVVLFVLGATYYWTQQPDFSGHTTNTAYASEKARPSTVELCGAVGPAMSIEAAYRAIPHNRTAFVPAQAQMSREESIYLEALFALTDCAVAERVYLQDRLRRGQAVDIRATNYRAILEGLSSLGTPAELLSVEGLINEAIEEQRDYLEQWAQSGNPKYFNRHAPLVQESHGKLIAAYLELIRRYGVESVRNRQAFYDYLCALDFI